MSRTESRRPHRTARLAVATAILAATLGPPCLFAEPPRTAGEATSEPPATATPATTTPSTAATFGFAVTGGAAAGYVDDQACAICHPDLAASYRQVGMSRSFARPPNAEPIEDLEAEPFFHPPSGRYYSMRPAADGGLTFKRWQIDDLGRQLNVFEQQVDWILGSGHTSRVYLYRTPGGELYQLPLAWYSQGRGWAMAPGFDRPVHEGVGRRIRRECMFCHNAYPDVPAGSDVFGAPHRFPVDLPEGTGCQRCHGPGAGHAATAFAGETDEAVLRGSIVNPGRLEPARRNDVCYGCHMQPTVELMGVRKFQRADYSFRPGEDLADYMVLMDAQASDQSREDRFEINHHPYRLEQSRCFEDSADLSCLTCHDPHRKVPVADRQAHYRAACLGCHQVEACGLPRMSSETRVRQGLDEIPAGDCVSCHMPRRRTQDVIHVAMTDHRIALPAVGQDLLAPRQEREPVLLDLRPLRPASAPTGLLGEIYRTVAVLQAGGGGAATDHLQGLLERTESPSPTPLMVLARSLVGQRRFTEAEAVLDRLDSLIGEHHLSAEWKALAAMSFDRPEQARVHLRRAVELEERPDQQYNLALVLASDGRFAEAEKHLRRAIELRPNSLPERYYLARVLAAQDRPSEAITAFRDALAVDPGDPRSYLSLGELLLAAGERQEALAVWRHGRRYSRRPELLTDILSQHETPTTTGASP